MSEGLKVAGMIFLSSPANTEQTDMGSFLTAASKRERLFSVSLILDINAGDSFVGDAIVSTSW